MRKMKERIKPSLSIRIAIPVKPDAPRREKCDAGFPFEFFAGDRPLITNNRRWAAERGPPLNTPERKHDDKPQPARSGRFEQPNGGIAHARRSRRRKPSVPISRGSFAERRGRRGGLLLQKGQRFLDRCVVVDI